MPPKKKETDVKAKKTQNGAPEVRKVQKRKRPVKEYQMAPVLPEGTVVNDIRKHRFLLGKAFAQGGFGRIYTAREEGDRSRTDKLVVKMEPAENGPIFQETHVYQRIAKSEMIDQWCKQNGLKFLGVPKFLSSGLQEYNGVRYRFLVMPRFGGDLETFREANGGKLVPLAALKTALCCLNALHYMHDQDYVHADLKAENLLFADVASHSSKSTEVRDFSKVVLVDFGLARKISEKVTSKEDPKRAHDGTGRYTSLDAHKGRQPSFRGDIEILLYNLLFWLTGSLPWKNDDGFAEKIMEKKQRLAETVQNSVRGLLGRSVLSDQVILLFQYIYSLDYAARPDYTKLEQLLRKALKKETQAGQGCSG